MCSICKIRFSIPSKKRRISEAAISSFRLVLSLGCSRANVLHVLICEQVKLASSSLNFGGELLGLGLIDVAVVEFLVPVGH